ncbi:MAG: hypothetical protein, partial [Olavius algarvensis Gamma 3 endosymbiont]
VPERTQDQSGCQSRTIPLEPWLRLWPGGRSSDLVCQISPEFRSLHAICRL